MSEPSQSWCTVKRTEISKRQQEKYYGIVIRLSGYTRLLYDTGNMSLYLTCCPFERYNSQDNFLTNLYRLFFPISTCFSPCKLLKKRPHLSRPLWKSAFCTYSPIRSAGEEVYHRESWEDGGPYLALISAVHQHQDTVHIASCNHLQWWGAHSPLAPGKAKAQGF